MLPRIQFGNDLLQKGTPAVADGVAAIVFTWCALRVDFDCSSAHPKNKNSKWKLSNKIYNIIGLSVYGISFRSISNANSLWIASSLAACTSWPLSWATHRIVMYNRRVYVYSNYVLWFDKINAAVVLRLRMIIYGVRKTIHRWVFTAHFSSLIAIKNRQFNCCIQIQTCFHKDVVVIVHTGWERWGTCGVWLEFSKILYVRWARAQTLA